MSDMSNFPVEEVLCRLPAKSIARFRSVSTDWASLLSDPYFSKLHCNRQQQNLRLVVRDAHLYSLDLDSLDCALRVDYLLKDSNFTAKKVLGLSNGLLCLSVSSSDPNPNPKPNPNPDHVEETYCGRTLFRTPEFNDDIIVICNLSTGARHIVPPASVDFGPEGVTMPTPYQLDRCFSYGFAFDPSSNDYKLIRISQYVYRMSRGACHAQFLSEIKVYSMITNSWTRVDHDLSPFCICYLAEPVLADGALHWVAGMNPDNNFPMFIIAYSLADSTFREVPHLTNELDIHKLNLGEGVGGPHKIYKISLGTVGGRLCVLCAHYNLECKIVIWKLDGNGDARSWEPLASFSRNGSTDEERVSWSCFWSSRLWGYNNCVFSNSGDKVLVERREDSLICCDLTEETATAGVSQINFITMQPSKN